MFFAGVNSYHLKILMSSMHYYTSNWSEDITRDGKEKVVGKWKIKNIPLPPLMGLSILENTVQLHNLQRKK